MQEFTKQLEGPHGGRMSAMSAFAMSAFRHSGEQLLMVTGWDEGWGQSSRTKQNWLRQTAVNAQAESRPCRHRKEARETF